MPKRILVVAHDLPLRKTRVDILQRAGYTVESVDSSDDAMALLGVEQFDLVLLGRKSLQSKKGLAQKLREKYPDLLTLKIEYDGEEENFYASRITDAAPRHVLAALHEMLSEHIRIIPANGLD